jgi:hypothetical protein
LGLARFSGFRLGLVAFLPLRFPIFISSCGLGGWRSNASIVRSVFSSTWGLPVMIASKKNEDFYGALGRLTISWARLELGLDCAVDVVHNVLGGNNINPTAPKTSLYRKTEYLRRWAKTVPEPTLRDATPILMDEIEGAAETRHDLIHGVIIKMEAGTGEAEMARIIHSRGASKPPFEKKYFKVTTLDILRAMAMGTGLQDLIPVLQKMIDKPEGEVGS